MSNLAHFCCCKDNIGLCISKGRTKGGRQREKEERERERERMKLQLA